MPTKKRQESGKAVNARDVGKAGDKPNRLRLKEVSIARSFSSYAAYVSAFKRAGGKPMSEPQWRSAKGK